MPGRTSRLLLCLPLLLFTTPLLADNFSFGVHYQTFIEALQSRQMELLRSYEAPQIKCGFGPGDEGPGCIGRTLQQNPGCQADMLLALKQGCRMSDSSGLSCIAPPQWGQTNILIAGARAMFRYTPDSDSLTVTAFICGGD